MSKYKVGEYYRDPDAGDIIKLIDVNEEECECTGQVIDDPYNYYSDKEWNSGYLEYNWDFDVMNDCYEKLPYYNTKLWRIMNE